MCTTLSWILVSFTECIWEKFLAFTFQGFEQHMSSPLHQSRMQEMINMHMRKTDQQLARMKAEEHLRKIEGKAKYVLFYLYVQFYFD